jgi:hypothetical protein
LYPRLYGATKAEFAGNVVEWMSRDTPVLLVHAAFARRAISDNCGLLKRRKEKSQQMGGSPQDTGLAEETVGF